MSRYWTYCRGRLGGPFPAEQLPNVDGFSRDALVCPEEGRTTDWQAAGLVPELKRLFSPPTDSVMTSVEQARMATETTVLVETLQAKVAELQVELSRQAEEKRRRVEELELLVTQLTQQVQELKGELLARSVPAMAIEAPEATPPTPVAAPAAPEVPLQAEPTPILESLPLLPERAAPPAEPPPVEPLPVQSLPVELLPVEPPPVEPPPVYLEPLAPAGVQPPALEPATTEETVLSQIPPIPVKPPLPVLANVETPSTSAQVEPVSARQLSILSADDDEEIRHMLYYVFHKAGHEIDFAQNGEEALTRIAGKRYDLVILDVSMPKRNGYMVAEAICNGNQPGRGRPKVLLMTSRDLDHERAQFILCGADAILPKDGDVRAIMAKAYQLTGISRA